MTIQNSCICFLNFMYDNLSLTSLKLLIPLKATPTLAVVTLRRITTSDSCNKITSPYKSANTQKSNNQETNEEVHHYYNYFEYMTISMMIYCICCIYSQIITMCLLSLVMYLTTSHHFRTKSRTKQKKNK